MLIKSFNFLKISSSNQKFHDFFYEFEPWNTPHALLRPGLQVKIMQNPIKCSELLAKNWYNRATWLTLYVWIAPNDITNWSAVETAERRKSDGYENENEKVKWEDAKRVHQREI